MRFISVILLLLNACLCFGQQAHQFTQFSQTKLNYNPAIAGLEEQLTITAKHRNQWSGIDGAPQGQSILVDLPFKSNTGLGVVLNRATIGIQSIHDITGMYTYKLKLRQASISLGLQASYRQFINDFSKEGLIAVDGFDLDPSISRERFSKNIFNVGFGAFLNSSRYYFGISVPRTLQSNIDLLQDANGSKQTRQLYSMFGLRFKLGPTWKIEPNFLLKLEENTPYDLDIQNNFIYQEQVHLGFNIRAGGTQESLFESLAFLIGFQFTETIFASMSYDFNTTTLRQFEEGSFEILLTYAIAKNRSTNNMQNPRYF